MRQTITRRDFLAIAGTVAIGTGTVSADDGDDEPVTFATYNVVDLRTEQVQSSGDEQAAAAARVIQEIRPDVLVLNELTNNRQASRVKDVPSSPSNARAFVENYLSVPQRSDLQGIDYPQTVMPTTNTGVASGLDLDNNGTVDETPGDRTYGNDAYGFGEFPGKYGLAILSRFPIRRDAIRTFRKFLWEDMPDNLLPRDPNTNNYLSDAEAEEFRLSSKTHIDVPIEIGDEVVHALAAHPTPPVFDGEGNFNGKRNHDEIRLLADYAAGADYIYDDSGRQGGLDDDSYVLMGDMNAAPGDAESLNAATEYFVENDGFVATPFPTSPGGAAKNKPRSRFWTAEFGSQVDYVLPSPDLGRDQSSVIWPSAATTERGLLDAVRTASDHRLVWANVPIEREDAEDDPEQDDGDEDDGDEDREEDEDEEDGDDREDEKDDGAEEDESDDD
ncbi:endonuclease/exonuclease/phosphatase family protein [Halococcus morrhuae DSM 1307]|uniref:Endonuclease/exonuclease/phosphatase family protein n=1 Tax=Halococcus morrhuae DSM 1307 TaxID=931277 RepID=M0MRZ3_HALMO|nr:endonuclease/exonuclease/phosphatase family protein [Halococcus morrhuae]EMA47489.1 endonuclease/exonuclease/phosphatase family protein [Halococcus morrhuae DSM 1307]